MTKRGQPSKYTFDQIKNKLEQDGFTLLDNNYSPSTHVKYSCFAGHVSHARGTNIMVYGAKCLGCARIKHRKYTMADVLVFSKDNGIIFLSDAYSQTNYPYKWGCPKGHIWFKSFLNIRGEPWCPECHGSKHKYTIYDCYRVAKERGGECLSKRYNPHEYLEWMCSKGHVWKAKFYWIVGKQHSWCPYCRVWYRECHCRRIIQELLNATFHKNKPSWLLNPRTGRRLELDGYNEKLGVAFEYNGEQHYAPHNKYDNIGYDTCKYKDALKKRLCKKHGVILITIPYTVKHNLKKYIKKRLKHHKLI